MTRTKEPWVCDHCECAGCGVWSPGEEKPSQWTSSDGRHYCYECSVKRQRSKEARHCSCVGLSRCRVCDPSLVITTYEPVQRTNEALPEPVRSKARACINKLRADYFSNPERAMAAGVVDCACGEDYMTQAEECSGCRERDDAEQRTDSAVPERRDAVKAAEDFVEEWLTGDEQVIAPLAEELNDAYNAGYRDGQKAPRPEPAPLDPEAIRKSAIEAVVELLRDMEAQGCLELTERSWALEDIIKEVRFHRGPGATVAQRRESALADELANARKMQGSEARRANELAKQVKALRHGLKQIIKRRMGVEAERWAEQCLAGVPSSSNGEKP